jgi:hypothetical protein
MTQADTATREFRVRDRSLDRHLARRVREASFEAAAVAYLEDHAWPAGDGHEISVVVQDTATGQEHCFRIDLDSGETTPCA